MTTPVAVAVRSAIPSDADALADAHRVANLTVEDARGGRLDTLLRGRVEPIQETFLADIESPTSEVLVATANELFAGYLVSELVELRSGESILSVVDLWVLEAARGIGLGSGLLTRSVETANRLGCVGIDARALPGDRATKNFFESFGLVARTIEVHKAL